VSRRAAAVLVLEIAATVAFQASGIGGLYATVAAGAIFFGTAAYLVFDARRLPLSERVRHFMSDRTTQLTTADADDREEHRLDTIECFEQRFGTDLRATLRRLHKRGQMGRREEQRLGAPRSLEDIEQLVTRLHELGH
jgi:hypothetical protein